MLFLNNIESLMPAVGPLTLKIAGHTALVGPSGAGKTTLFRSLLGLTRCKGDVVLDGRTLTKNGQVLCYGPRRNISMAWQDDRLLPHLNLLQNASISESEATATEWCDILGIAHLMTKFPHQVSGGEAQRANLARALASKSRVILLDEPFHGIDAPMVRKLLVPVLDRLSRENRFVVMISHDVSCILGVFQQIIVMNDKRSVFHGEVSDLYNNPQDAWLARFMGDYHILQNVASFSEKTARSNQKYFVRPEWLALDNTAAIKKNSTVLSSLWKGATQQVLVLLDGREEPLQIEVSSSTPFSKGERVNVNLKKFTCPDWTHI